MKKEVLSRVKRCESRKRQVRRQRLLAAGLSCVVIFSAVHARILPAAALESEGTVYCGLAEHEHDESCYESRLVCGYAEETPADSQETAEQTGHVHTEDCYEEQSVLSCGKEEGAVHTHTEDCYEQTLSCVQEESEGHTHTDACYEKQTVLSCKLEESEGHTHTEDCYNEAGETICGQEESEGHTHTEGCYEEQSVQICGQEEGEGHTHTEDCYERTLSCGQEEGAVHAHTDACYELRNVLVCGYEEQGSDVKESEEGNADGGDEAHVHTEDCYEQVLVCEQEEHTHTLICYSNPDADVESEEDWEKTLPELCGDAAYDLAAVAKSQLGYAESRDNYDVTEDGEARGYTRYGAWYGEPYAEWNALFAAFCLHYANVNLPWAADSAGWIAALKEQAPELYEEAQDWEPYQGNLVFFDSDGDGNADRMGIAVDCGDTELTVVEGDCDGKVESVTYSVSDGRIMGYGLLPVTGIMTMNVGEYQQLNQFYLWMYANDEEVLAEPKWVAGTGFVGDGIKDALKYTDKDNEVYYLIPVSYFIEKYKDYGYTFDPENTEDGATSPIQYAPDAYHKESKQYAQYIYVTDKNTGDENSGWYVRVQDKGTTYSGPPRSNVYYTYEIELVENFRMWMHVKQSEDSAVNTVARYDSTNSTSPNDDLNDVLKKTETVNGITETYYLIPVSYFTKNYGAFDYTFDPEMTANGADSPIQYAPDANSSNENLTTAKYVYVKAKANEEEANSGWYVQVQDSQNGNYNDESGIPRSNVYYTAASNLSTVDKFYLWMYARNHGDTEYTKVKGYSEFIDNGDDSNVLTDVLRLWNGDDTKKIYLIPVSYFIENYNEYGYTFDPNSEVNYPVNYAPNASNRGENIKTAGYVYVDSKAEENNAISGWYVQIEDTTEMDIPRSNVYFCNRAKTVEGLSPSGAVINLFDYWVQSEQENDVTESVYDKGINAGHALKFKASGLEWKDDDPLVSRTTYNKSANYYTWSTDVYTGIVQNTLKDGYPVLTDKEIFVTNNGDNLESGNEEPLDYLFDPAYTGPSVAYRDVHENVTGLLQMNDGGYYYYKSSENYAEYDENKNQFILYDDWAVTYKGDSGHRNNGQFFPFDPYSTVSDFTDAGTDNLNHYFGMTLTARFYQQHGGHTDANRQTDTIFSFSGDDDVWIFIDDVLVADLGGIHDEASVEINFDSGKVIVNGSEQTTLKAAFVNAGKYAEAKFSGETFADETYHTLKFFYMERGSYASDLSLMYNLSSYPPTSIYKVNQYGEVVPGATFAVYAADDQYHILSDRNGSKADLKNGFEYDDKGNMVKDGQTLAKALYTGTTDEQGEMIFLDSYKQPYTLAELQDMFGDHFVLKEIKVPEGYRLVNDTINLYVYNNKVLLCDNTSDSGVYATASLLASAPSVLKKVNGDTVNYVDGNHTSSGELFAVVLKYTGSGTEGLTEEANWVPVYGTSKSGYAAEPVNGNFIEAAISAAKKNRDKYGLNVVFAQAEDWQMQLMLEELPGNIRNYYYMLGKDKSSTQYTVAYYWTEGKLENANSSNTYRIDADAQGYSFSRSFGATVAVPNLVNRLFAQKLSEDGSLVNGAAFALYRVSQENNGPVYYQVDGGTLIYLEKDEDGDNQGKARLSTDEELTGSYTVDGTSGKITVQISGKEYVIAPADKAVTLAADVEENLAGENGTASFSDMTDGYYYLREISAPEGYRLNPAEVMVLVDDTAVYANAGTEKDGVTVGRGPGYVCSSLTQFASEGLIDNTLTWVYERMKVTGVSTSFTDVYKPLNDGGWQYLQSYTGTGFDAKTLTTDKEGEAMTTYLKYLPGNENTLFNYTVNEGRYKSTEGVTRRMYTSVGWSYYLLYQDYEYGSEKSEETGAGYADWRDKGDISNLFSRSTFVQISDEYDGTALTVRKVDAADQARTLADAEFVLYYTGEGGVKHYYTGPNSWTALADGKTEKDYVRITDENGIFRLKGVADGSYSLKELAAPEGYVLTEQEITFTVKDGRITEASAGTVSKDGLVLTVANSAGYTLPSTGGPGTAPYYLGGALLMGIALILMGKRRKDAKR